MIPFTTRYMYCYIMPGASTCVNLRSVNPLHASRPPYATQPRAPVQLDPRSWQSASRPQQELHRVRHTMREGMCGSSQRPGAVETGGILQFEREQAPLPHLGIDHSAVSGVRLRRIHSLEPLLLRRQNRSSPSAPPLTSLSVPSHATQRALGLCGGSWCNGIDERMSHNLLGGRGESV